MEYEEATIRVGISSCLLGEKVRWNGDHKEDRYVTGTLAQCFEWVPVCPEVEIALGTPRETIQLVGDPETPRLKTTRSDMDLTDQMLKYASDGGTSLLEMIEPKSTRARGASSDERFRSDSTLVITGIKNC